MSADPSVEEVYEELKGARTYQEISKDLMGHSWEVIRVAKAIHKTYTGMTPWEKLSDRMRVCFIEKAIAAMEALRDPTHAMGFGTWKALDARDHATVWRTMMDNALGVRHDHEDR